MKYRVIFFCLVLILFKPAKADDKLDALLENKVTEYKGYCYTNLKKEIVFEKTTSTRVQQCIIGSGRQDGNNKFILLFTNQWNDALIKYNTKTKKQEIIWTNPDSLV